MDASGWIAIVASVIIGLGGWGAARIMKRIDSTHEAIFGKKSVQLALLAKIRAVESQFARFLPRTDAEKQQRQVMDYLDTIRTEAHRREERILIAVNNLSEQQRADTADLRQEVRLVHARFDNVVKRVDNLVDKRHGA